MTHAINWFEIPVTDMDRAQRFYETLTGTRLKREPFGGPGNEMCVFDRDGADAIKGALFKAPMMQPSEAGSVVYLNAAPAIDAWIGRVDAAGGKVLIPKVTLPDGMGYFAHIQDSEGNRVGLHALA
ncbi:VOC family protein [Hydrogenophaga sp. 5NK40-0174]|uniref:VOC family protein n=1 Tax=Hydrogenophaga sp. 5NK40-0174 TaxID=3127649 RepID=UPI00310B983B